MTRTQGRLQLHNDVIPLDDTIESYPRTKKVPYKQVEYKKKYIPPEFKDPLVPVVPVAKVPVVPVAAVAPARRSDRLNPAGNRPMN